MLSHQAIEAALTQFLQPGNSRLGQEIIEAPLTQLPPKVLPEVPTKVPAEVPAEVLYEVLPEVVPAEVPFIHTCMR